MIELSSIAISVSSKSLQVLNVLQNIPQVNFKKTHTTCSFLDNTTLNIIFEK